MLRNLVTSAHRLLAEISQHRTPDRVAMGIALGTSFGLVPMDNFVSVTLLLAILFLPVHQLSAAIALVVVGSFSPVLWPVPDAIGHWFLSLSWARSLVASLHALPLVPWFRLNNTLVMGGVLFGLTTWAPQYLVMRWLARRAQRQLADWSVEEIADEALNYRKAMVAATRFKAITQAAVQTLAVSMPENATKPVAVSASDASTTHAQPSQVISIAAEPQVAATEVDRSTRVDADHRSRTAMPTHDFEAAETVLRETIIEVVRFRHSHPHVSSPIEPMNEVMVVEQNHASRIESKTPSTVGSTHLPEVSGAQSSAPVKLVFDPIHQPLVGPKSSNSLRYLMRYLASSRDAHHESETHS